MELRQLCNQKSLWLSGKGDMSDIVISSRVRLARNLAGYEFVWRCSDESRQNILEKVKNVLENADIDRKISYISIDKAGQIDKDFLVERHLISKNLSEEKGIRGVFIGQDELFAVMVNEEDHLRIQVLRAGLAVEDCWQEINRIDDIIESKLEYAFSEKYGYLTACPTNVGTGLRVSVMLHLPGLKITGHLEKFINAAKAMNLAVRGLFGEGTEAVGDCFQLSNQMTLGINEKEIVNKFTNEYVPKIVEYEKLARAELSDKKAKILDDKIFRALGILRHAQMISSQEALYLLSNLRLGVNMGKIEGIDIGKINDLFMLIQPGHIQISQGGPLNSENRDEIRAKIIRNYLSNN